VENSKCACTLSPLVGSKLQVFIIMKTAVHGDVLVIAGAGSHHINQLRDLESEADPDRVVDVLDGPDPALVALEKVPQEGVLHLRQGHKLTLS